jgi:hypothetical protein
MKNLNKIIAIITISIISLFANAKDAKDCKVAIGETISQLKEVHIIIKTGYRRLSNEKGGGVNKKITLNDVSKTLHDLALAELKILNTNAGLINNCTD